MKINLLGSVTHLLGLSENKSLRIIITIIN